MCSLNSTSWMKWYCMLICFVQTWYSEFFTKAIVLWLFTFIDTESQSMSLYSSFNNNLLIQTAFFMMSDMVIYSASHENRMIMICCFECQDTTPLSRVNMYLVVNCLVFLSPSQFKSEYLCTFSVCSLFDLNLISIIRVLQR